MGGFWKMVIEALGGAFLTSIFSAFRIRRQDAERDTALIGQERGEQRAANAEAQSKISKDMLDAQTNAPNSRSDLADRLRRDALAEGETEAGAAPNNP